MNTKEEIEAFVATAYLKRVQTKPFVSDKLLPGNPPEPDVIYDGAIGIEVGYVGLPQNIAADIQEKQFVQQLNQHIGQRLADDFEVNLVMQDDKDVVDHSPMDGMEPYPVMARYLDGLSVHTGRQSHRLQVIVNQRSATRPENLFPNARDLQTLADELVKYVAQLTEADFQLNPLADDKAFRFHRRVVCLGAVNKERLKSTGSTTGTVGSLVPKKIIDKLEYNKYEEGYDCRVLLLHNYMPRTGSIFDSNTHLYTHLRDELLAYLRQLIRDNDTAKKYDRLVFLDFSIGIGTEIFSVVDLANRGAGRQATTS